MRSENRSRCNREILLAGPAPIARGLAGTAAVVGVPSATMRADRITGRVRPAAFAERGFGFLIRHAEHLDEGERFSVSRKEEVLGHDNHHT